MHTLHFFGLAGSCFASSRVKLDFYTKHEGNHRSLKNVVPVLAATFTLGVGAAAVIARVRITSNF